VNCTNTVEANAQWNDTTVSLDYINGKCLSGFQGSVSRRCVQNGLVGNWGAISGYCEGTFSSFSLIFTLLLYFFISFVHFSFFFFFFLRIVKYNAFK